MHLPKELTKAEGQLERIALIGAPGSGKTTACLTFPNRIFYDFDHKLPQGEACIPMWDANFVSKLVRNTFTDVVNRRDAFKKHLRENYQLFTPEQTLIIDSWSLMQNAFDQQTQREEDMADKPNPFAFWKRKAQYAVEIMEMLKGCRCRVVVTFHETVERDAEGETTGKLRPVMDGSFKDQLLGHFTDVWRQLCAPYEKDEAGRDKIVNGKKLVRVVEHQNNSQWKWFWQLGGDALVNTNTNPDLGRAIQRAKVSTIPADYSEVQKLYGK